MRAATTVLERDAPELRPESLAAIMDWESPAGGPTALPRIARLSFTYLGTEDEHLRGQFCLALEPLESAAEWCRVAFACGCRARVLRSLLQPR